MAELGYKDTKGKLRMDLLPMDSLRDIAAVYTMGAAKYADENWRKGVSWKKIYGAVMRHLSLWFLGMDVDEESGLPHLAHAAWGLLTLLNYRRTHPELDDRPDRSLHPGVDAETRSSESHPVQNVLPGTHEMVCGPEQNKETPGRVFYRGSGDGYSR